MNLNKSITYLVNTVSNHNHPFYFNFYSIQVGSINNGQIKLYINGSRQYGGDVHFSPNSGAYWDHVSWNGDFMLNASDYVEVICSAAHTFHGGNWSAFSGHLVG